MGFEQFTSWNICRYNMTFLLHHREEFRKLKLCDTIGTVFSLSSESLFLSKMFGSHNDVQKCVESADSPAHTYAKVLPLIIWE